MSWMNECGLNKKQINTLRNEMSTLSDPLIALAMINAEEELTALSPASPISGTIIQAQCYLLMVTDLLDELEHSRKSPIKAILHDLNKPTDNQR